MVRSNHQTDMCCNDLPATRHLHPGLLLATHFVTPGTAKFGAGDRHIIAKGGDGGVDQITIQPLRRARGAEGADGFDTVQILTGTKAHGAWVMPEQLVEHVDIIADYRLLITIKRGVHFGQNGWTV